MSYDYKRMKDELFEITENNADVNRFIIGKSVMGKELYGVSFGKGTKKIFLSGAYHGLEYLTSVFLIKFLDEYIKHTKNNDIWFGYNTKKLYESTTLYVVPMVNPDGVDIAIHGLDITNPHHRHLISVAGIHSFNEVWQANANGVDINHNFNANWEMTVNTPSPTKYGGEFCESEPETKAVTDFIRKENFDALAAFHSQGREIYYDFDGMASQKAQNIAERMAKESGYAVAHPVGSASYGGCKDWFIKEFGKLGFTIEIGKGKNPLPLSMINDIFEENAKIALCLMDECVG